MTEFERAIGWNGHSLKSLVGRDISVGEQGGERRGPIRKAKVTVDGYRGYAFIQFIVDWVALREGDRWNLESEPSDPENGISEFGMNPGCISSEVDSLTGEVHCGKATIHRPGDNISKPEVPT